MLQDAVQFIQTHDDFLLIAHVSPDGDTLGSCLALYCALLKMNKRAKVSCSDALPVKYAYLPHAKEIVPYDRVSDFRSIITVDCADIARMGRCMPYFSEAEDSRFQINFSATRPSSHLRNDLQP